MGALPKIPSIEAVISALYISDCHVTGLHDPCHTARRVCELQLQDLAVRVLREFGIDLSDLPADDEDKRRVVSQIPRRIDRTGWFRHYIEINDVDSVTELLTWEDVGCLNTEDYHPEIDDQIKRIRARARKLCREHAKLEREKRSRAKRSRSNGGNKKRRSRQNQRRL